MNEYENEQTERKRAYVCVIGSDKNEQEQKIAARRGEANVLGSFDEQCVCVYALSVDVDVDIGRKAIEKWIE